MAPHSSTLAWKIPWAEEPGRLQSMGSWRVGHNWVTSLSLPCIGEGNGSPLQCSCLEHPRDGGAWWAAVYGVTQSRTRLKRLSSSRSNSGSRKRDISASWSLTLMNLGGEGWPLSISSNFWKIFIFGRAGSSLLCCREWCLLSRCHVQASHCHGFPCAARPLGTRAAVVAPHGLSSCSSPTPDRRLSSCGSRA